MTSPKISRVGAYDLLEKVGQGGMSTVYKGRHGQTLQVVAVKVAARTVVNDPFASKRFELEHEVAQQLQHPDLVKVLDHGSEGAIPYLVMEFVDGLTLAEVLKKEGRLDEAAALPIFLQIADALSYLHDRQIIHRDIKPENILVNSQGQAKLVDLGLSKNLDSAAELTRSRIGLGTMQFAAPEQFDNARSADARSDVYSLAATMYLALTGELPYGRGGGVLQRKLHNQFAAPITKNAQIHPCVDAAIRLGLQADRDCRPASCRDFAALLTGNRRIPVWVELAPNQPARAAKGKRSAGSRSDRRAGSRYATELESNCRLVGGLAQRWPAVIKNISTRGMCLFVNHCFEAGSLLDVLFALDEESTLTSELALVRWVKQTQDNGWLLGCEFSRELGGDELDAFLHERQDTTDMF